MANNVSEVNEEGPIGGAGTDGAGKGVGVAGVEEKGDAIVGSSKVDEKRSRSIWCC